MTHNQYPAPEQATIMEADASAWHNRVDGLMADGAHIITVRGAGTINGIDPGAAEGATKLLTDYVTQLAEGGAPVALMFDGDEDNREKPDVGSVFGGIADAFKDTPNVTALAAQQKSWYYPKSEGGSLESAAGTPYETYVFPDDMPGSHAALTQSGKLVAYPKFEEVFVGPAGKIAFDQLKDLSDKAATRPPESGPVSVTIVETPNNANLTPILVGQLAAAPDEQAKAKVQAKIDQRRAQPLGALFSPEGQFTVDQAQYPGLAFKITPVGITEK